MTWTRVGHLALASLALLAALTVMGCDPASFGLAAEPAPTVTVQAPPLPPAPYPVTKPSPGPVPLPEEPSAFDPGEDGRLSLREFYMQKYPEGEREAVRRTVAEALPRYGAADLDQAVAEILAFHHVVYHRTRLHDLEKNHAVARRVESLLREVARRFEVPYLPLLAIVSWENSGDLDKVSWADAAGLGQMTWGAVDRAHAFAAEEAAGLRPLLEAASSEGAAERVADLERQIRALDLAGRHKELAHEAGATDERSVARCNLEDAAMFLKYLLAMYGGREDLAISAYHNGVLNNDDILYDYLLRQGESLAYPGDDRTEFLEVLERRNVTYLDLWRDTRSRQMLNGLRTVEGERTTPQNSHMALGDESDIYPWKVLGSLAAYQAGPEWTASNVARYADRWDLVEVRGLPELETFAAFEDAERSGHLVKAAVPVLDLGLGGRAPEGSRARRYAYYATPEMVGYLADLADRLRQASGNPEVRLPVANLSAAATLGEAKAACPGGQQGNHLRGVAVDLVPGALAPAQAKVLDGLLWSDYLMDRVYLARHPGGTHVVLNPRRGDDFLASYQKRFSAAATEPR